MINYTHLLLIFRLQFYISWGLKGLVSILTIFTQVCVCVSLEDSIRLCECVQVLFDLKYNLAQFKPSCYEKTFLYSAVISCYVVTILVMSVGAILQEAKTPLL